MRNVDPSCTADYDPNALSIEEARARILGTIRPPGSCEYLAVRKALGKVLYRDVQATISVPPYANSAMDGFALRSDDLREDGPVTLQIVGTSFAGRPSDYDIQAGQAVRVMTGAVLPASADLVVMQEHVSVEGEWARLSPGYKAGENVRQVGDDVKRGSIVLRAGKRLMPADIGLLASVGVSEVPVYSSPLVAFFSTGDELCSLGNTLGVGQIYDSNRYTLYGMLERAGVTIMDLGVVPDERHALERIFEVASRKANVIISSGGVSVGEADYVKEVFEKHGKINFWKIAMKPGRPLLFGQFGNAVFFGLPGNPVSVMVVFYQIVLPALQRMQGQTPDIPLTIRVRSHSTLKKKPGRLEFQRGLLKRHEDGSLSVSTTGLQDSHVLTSMSQANCFILLPSECNGVEAGELVDVQPFAGLI